MLKTALYGGAFDPIHNGHVDLAKNVMDKFNIDEFIFVPTYKPPHKAKHVASSIDRLNMLNAAIDELGKKFSVTDFEINSSSISYTYNTLLHFNKKNLFFVAGSDIFAIIESWYRWKELFDLATFIVVERKGVSFDEMFSKISFDLSDITITFDEYQKGKKGKVILFKADIVEIASSDIRGDIERYKEFVPIKTLDYIRNNRLYLGSTI